MKTTILILSAAIFFMLAGCQQQPDAPTKAEIQQIVNTAATQHATNTADLSNKLDQIKQKQAEFAASNPNIVADQHLYQWVGYVGIGLLVLAAVCFGLAMLPRTIWPPLTIASTIASKVWEAALYVGLVLKGGSLALLAVAPYELYIGFGIAAGALGFGIYRIVAKIEQTRQIAANTNVNQSLPPDVVIPPNPAAVKIVAAAKAVTPAPAVA